MLKFQEVLVKHPALGPQVEDATEILQSCGSTLCELDLAHDTMKHLGNNIFVLCPNLTFLSVYFNDAMSSPSLPKVSDFVADNYVHHHLAKLNFHLPYLRKAHVEIWDPVFSAFEPTHFPNLREVRVECFKWPTTEREIAKSYWVRWAERLLKNGISMMGEDDQFPFAKLANVEDLPPRRKRLVRNLPCTLELSDLSVLPPLEEDSYKLQVARKIRASKEAEVQLVTALLTEARATVASRQAEIKLAGVREEEAQSRVEYYSRMIEAAEDQAVSTLLVEAHATVASRQAEIKLAVAQEEESQSRVQYYSRLAEVAADNLVDAELQIGVIRHRILNCTTQRFTVPPLQVPNEIPMASLGCRCFGKA
ncbi:hypothetical protein B0H19DRAFT_1370903 [Mycena capillaripes]|nr:hypothetical protein B0H19DRAFT_1370903 [Mycena capillaripes]